MKNILKCGALLAVLIVAAALPAHADRNTLDLNPTGPITGSWIIESTPAPFFNISDLGGSHTSVALDDLFEPQVHGGDASDPMFTGKYYFTSRSVGDREVLTVTQTPEPASLLLLASGLAALGWKRKRQGETA